MKALHLLLIAIFTLTLGLTALSGDVLAAADKKEVITPAEKATAPLKVAPDEKSSAAKATKSIPKDVNINTADKEMLTQLPGIGPVITNTI